MVAGFAVKRDYSFSDMLLVLLVKQKDGIFGVVTCFQLMF